MSTKNKNIKIYLQVSFLAMFALSILIVILIEKPDSSQAPDQPQWLSLEQIDAKNAALLRELEALRAQPTEKNAARTEQLEIELSIPLTKQERAELNALTKLVTSQKATKEEEKRCFQLIEQENYAALKALNDR